jgi:hypothetical protein
MTDDHREGGGRLSGPKTSIPCASVLARGDPLASQAVALSGTEACNRQFRNVPKTLMKGKGN